MTDLGAAAHAAWTRQQRDRDDALADHFTPAGHRVYVITELGPTGLPGMRVWATIGPVVRADPVGGNYVPPVWLDKVLLFGEQLDERRVQLDQALRRTYGAHVEPTITFKIFRGDGA